MLAGLKVETELADPETVKLIAGVIAKFDPRKSIDEDEFLFESRFEVFESIQTGERGFRNKATKNVSDAYLRSVERNEKEQEKKRKT